MISTDIGTMHLPLAVWAQSRRFGPKINQEGKLTFIPVLLIKLRQLRVIGLREPADDTTKEQFSVFDTRQHDEAAQNWCGTATERRRIPTIWRRR